MMTNEIKEQILSVLTPFITDLKRPTQTGYAARYEALWHSLDHNNLHGYFINEITHGNDDDNKFSVKDHIWIERHADDEGLFCICTVDDWRRNDDGSIPPPFKAYEFDDQGVFRFYTRLQLRGHISVVNPAHSTKYHGIKDIYDVVNSKDPDARKIQLSDFFTEIPAAGAIHTTAGLYPNGPYKLNGVTTENLITHITYNLQYRPGRALYINGWLVYEGMGVNEEQVQMLEDSFVSGRIGWFTKDTQPYQ